MLLPLQAILQPTSTQTPPVCAFHGIYLCLFCCVRGLLLLISLPFGFPHGNAHRVNNYGWYNSPTLIKEIWTKKISFRLYKRQNYIMHETARQVKLWKIHTEWMSYGLPLHALSRQHCTQIKLGISTSENVAEAESAVCIECKKIK